MQHPAIEDPRTRRSLRHSLHDAGFFAVMAGAGESYLSAFAVFLKATTTQIGVLASLPPLVGAFTQLLSVGLSRYGWRRRSIMLAGAGLQSLAWLPLLILPLLFPAYAPYILIGCVIAYYAAGNVIAPQWNSLIGELVPPTARGWYFARRTRRLSVISFAAMIIAGMVLDVFDRYSHALAGFVVIFSVAAVARLLSARQLGLMHEPAPCEHGREPSWRASWQGFRSSPVMPFSIFYATMQMAAAVAAPFFTVYMLRDLEFSYVQFTAASAAYVLLQFLTLKIWGRISDGHGNRIIMVITGVVIPIQPVLWLVSESFWYVLALQALGGVIWAGFSLATTNYMYDLVPAGQRVGYFAIHHVLTGIGVFIGAVLGGYLATVLPKTIILGGYSIEWVSALPMVFLVSALGRLCVSAVFIPRVREVRNVSPFSLRRLWAVEEV